MKQKKWILSLLGFWLAIPPLWSQPVTIRDTAANNDELVDIVYLNDGSKLMGHIKDMDSQRLIMEVQGANVQVDAKKVERVSRNVNLNPDANKPRLAEITLKDKWVLVGQISRTEGENTYIQTGGSEVSIRTNNIVSMRYIDADQVKLKEIEKSRKAGFEVALKGGSHYYQTATFENTLKPGFFALGQLSLPHWFIAPAKLNLQLGVQSGYISNVGKKANTRIDLIPTTVIFDVIYPVPRTRLDLSLGLLGGGNITRVITSNTEKVSLDPSYGSELAIRYHLTSQISLRIGGQWYGIYQPQATLNHWGNYLAVGYRI